MQIKKKKARVVILISDKIDFKTKAVERDKEGNNPTRECKPSKPLYIQRRST